MFGPKLDPRSYTTLLLIVIACLLTFNLMAQRGTTAVEANEYSEVGSTAEVASATREVARANREIAAAISELASAVNSLELVVQAGETAPAGGAAQGAAPADANSPEAYESIDPDEEFQPEGSFEIN